MNPEERDDIKRHFDVVGEGLRSEIRLVADGVAHNTERIDGLSGRVEEFRGETRRSFSELRAQIKLSSSELDRRLTTLEEGHAALLERVDRIEAKLAS